ncbi:anti-virulence regulator CigR family protein [Pseudomonas sp. 2FG]|uniref:anti-virulence regulator CigR family protein n=1 Tax=Pseudomonas sp. 2FG TaxID=2502191 RepID=UPI0010FA1F12|nr:anti-virulence regulator CigR family protein [Pseudomonas sp. 2FG]
MPLPRSLLLIFTSLALALSTPALMAAPKNAHGNQGNYSGGGYGYGYDDHDVTIKLNGPQIDIGRVRIILGDNRDLIGPVQSLPPGIQKNLARGKPLPPGIAKRFDSRLLGKLPHYAGYEWQQVGRDVVLVTLATGLIYEMLHDILD